MKPMNNTDTTGNAVDRVEQAKRLIQDACRTRLDTRCPTQEEIERTRRVNEAMARLACLIDGMHKPADQESSRTCAPLPRLSDAALKVFGRSGSRQRAPCD